MKKQSGFPGDACGGRGVGEDSHQPPFGRALRGRQDRSRVGANVSFLLDAPRENGRVGVVNVVLVKLGRGSRAVVGRLVRTPRKGSVIVIEFSDGMHEYVTTPVKRVLKLAGKDVYYVETANSRYRLEVRGKVEALDGAGASSG
jgi:hypothetical protein